MTKGNIVAFIINKGFDSERKVDATFFAEKDSLIIFSRPRDSRTSQQVFALPVSHVETIAFDES